MPAPLVIAGGLALRRGAVWVGGRLVTGLGRLGSFLGKRMSLGTLANAANLLSTTDNAMPSHYEEVDVTVFGSPKAKKRDLWRIAIAAAFGKIQRRDAIRGLPPPGFLQMEYPLEGNAVRVVLRQETPYFALFAGHFRTTREFELYSGPPDDLSGGAWAFTSALPGVGAGFGADYPKTGYEDRTLLTTSPTYKDATGAVKATASPHPIKDKVSRGSAPIAESTLNRTLDPNNTNIDPTYLLYQALSAPCEPTLIAPPTGPSVTPPPAITDLITGEPFPLPTEEPSGKPDNDPSEPSTYTPPEPQTQPPAPASQNPQLPAVDLSVPIAQATFGSLNGLFNAAESNITGLNSGAVGSLSSYFLGLGDEFDRQKNLGQATLNFASGISKTPPVAPVLPPVTPSIGGGSSY